MSRKKTARLRSHGVFNMGRERAEDDPLLESAFFESDKYQTLKDKDERSVILVGRTGAGKSAVFRRLQSEYPDNFILLRPQDMSLPYLTNLDVIQKLSDQGVRLDPFFTALWKHVFLVEIMKHRYKIDSPEKQSAILGEWRRIWKADRGKQLALEYVEQFGNQFWCDTDERVRQVAENFAENLTAGGGLYTQMGLTGAGAGVGLRAETETGHSISTSTEMTQRYQRIVDATQIAKIDAMIGELNKRMLDRANYTFFMIDDLDRDWVDESVRIALIRCLLEAVLDMGEVENLKMIVAMRKNIIRQLDYGSQKRGPQQEKIEQMIMPLNWSESDLNELAEQRVIAASHTYKVEPPLTLRQYLPNANRVRGDSMDYILERTMLRPRDVILYLNEIIRVSNNRRKITWEHIYEAEIQYSMKRFEALRDEWKDPYFRIDLVLLRFRRAPAVLKLKQLIEILDDIACYETSNPAFENETWLTEACAPIWQPSLPGAIEYDEYVPLSRILFEIGFLGVRSHQSRIPTYVFDVEQESILLDLEEDALYVIHPALRSFLQCR